MAVTVTNMIMGPATIYGGDYQAPEPFDTQVNNTPAGSAWTDLGGTQDGVATLIDQTLTALSVDQVLEVPERRKTAREVKVRTNMAEPTLENLVYVLNGGTITTGSGYKAYDPEDGLSSDEPGYSALIIDGQAPSYKRRRLFCRKVLSIENVESSYKKDGQTLYPVTWGCHYVSASVKSFRYVDAV